MIIIDKETTIKRIVDYINNSDEIVSIETDIQDKEGFSPMYQAMTGDNPQMVEMNIKILTRAKK